MIGKIIGLLGGIIGASLDDKDSETEEYSNNPHKFDEDRWNKLIEKINNSLDNEQYEKADSQLGNYYRQFENNEKDYWFYYFRTCILLRKLEDTGVEHSGLKPCILEARRMAFDEEHIKEIKNLENRYRAAIEESCFDDECEYAEETVDDDPQMVARKEYINKIVRWASLEVVDDCGEIYRAYENSLKYLSDDEKSFCSNTFYAQFKEVSEYGWHYNWEIDGWDDEDDISSIRIHLFSARGILFHQFLINDSQGLTCDIDEWKVKWSDIKRFVPQGLKYDSVRFETEGGKYNSDHRFEINAKKWMPILERIISSPLLSSNVDNNFHNNNKDSISTIEQTAVFGNPSESHCEKIAEDLYKEEVLYILQDGDIGLPERKLLDRKKNKLGLSEEQVKRIEASCTRILTNEEQEYVDIYKDLIEDGEPTGRLRKLLDREAKALGLSPEQVAKVEQMIK